MATTFASLKSRIRKVVPRPLKGRLGLLLDVLTTEYNFRFNQRSIHKALERSQSLPINLHIEGTNVCNAKCAFCAYPQMERAKETMPLEDFQRVIDDFVQLGGQFVSLTPIVGDPFVDRWIFERLDYLNECPQIKGFDFYTNGILLKPAVIQKLVKYADKLHIQVSFGGFDRETYRAVMGVDYYELVRQNLEAFFALKRSLPKTPRLSLALRCPTSNCAGDFWESCWKAVQEGILSIQTIETFDSWAGKVSDEALRRVGLEPVLPPHKRGACELLFMKPVILANGKVNACACRDVEAELIIGDLKQSSLSEIWAGEAIDNLIERHEHGDYPDVCKRCTWYTSIYNTRKQSYRINKTAIALNKSDAELSQPLHV